MPELSRVAKATTNSKSLRATIPEKIVEELKLNVGDLLVWTTEEHKGKKTVAIQKWES
ncbi:MAG TPA: AbrB/MazE/SpoVT family DNA-binding domain-containing protein [Nitrosopumilaceae archaeon]|nr:AbrB/MazE/SpoVT family DNA-binding domain-containing protein [Nitrosopumilaceae archaeon]